MFVRLVGFVASFARRLPSSPIGVGPEFSLLVAQGGPAEEAGLKKGDIIMRWDETPVTSKAEFARQVTNSCIGAHVVLQVVRQPRGGPPNTTTTVIEYFKVCRNFGAQS